jgi:type IV pilus assembly protein PilQ
MITGIAAQEDAGRVLVKISSSGKLTYTAVKQPDPLGVVLYFPETDLAADVPSHLPGVDFLSGIQASELTDRGRASRIEMSLKTDRDYTVDQEDGALTVSFSKPAQAPMKAEPAVASGHAVQDSGQPPEHPMETQPASTAQPAKATSAATAPVVKPAKPATTKPAWVNRIDFASEAAGKSTILIGTTHPVKYMLKKIGAHRLLLTLENTRLPAFRERPLITTRFQSAVDRILPARKAGKPESAVFTIDLRASVPYFVEQQDRLLMVHFDATSVPPRPLTTERAPAWEAAMAGTAKGEQAKAASASEPAPGEASTGSVLFPKKHYTGEKIALDFYETDIKNVFRILKEVSGKNFAIDKDVTGTVTLSFEKPVPWDQVLDLILQMNQLGKVEEGDIIRIATIATLKREEDDRQAALAAKKKAEEQQVALEPLETRYIRVNYANAKNDILPHLQKLVTEGRGSVTVDERSNQVIMTDTASKIAQARALVKQLDNVTPQVIIEARIVEVTDKFSDDLGISWHGSQTNVQKDFLGGNIDWNVAMNFPAASNSSIGINFERIAGTPLLLDATLTAIETKGEGKIISAPKIVTLDNQKAMIKQGVEVGYLERDDAGGSSVKFKNVDLLLEVTPHVTPDQRVSMNIHITKNDVGDIINGVPSLNSNEAQTELLVNDGDTIVIGGILKRTRETGTTGWPGLSEVPVVSWLFKEKSSTDSTGELLIFITPQIVQLAQR